jgi:hypothetical protein
VTGNGSKRLHGLAFKMSHAVHIVHIVGRRHISQLAKCRVASRVSKVRKRLIQLRLWQVRTPPKMLLLLLLPQLQPELKVELVEQQVL